MKRLLFILLFLSTAAAKAESGYTMVTNDALASQHAWDHLGVSFAAETLLYGFSKQALRMDPMDARIFSFAATMLFTTLYTVMETAPTAPVPGHDLLMNGLGAGLAVGATFVFHF